MAGKKKNKKAGKKGKKGKKARKAEKKAAKKAQKAAKKAVSRGPRKAPKAARRSPRRTAKQAARKAPVGKALDAAARPVLKSRKQPESLRLRSAGPSLTVNDIHRSLAFYRDVLGFTLRERWEEDGALKGVEMVAGSVRFWLGQDDWKKGRDRAKGQGFRMYCATSQDIDTFAARVKAAGGSVVEEPKDQSWGGRDFAVRDPDGFLITFSTGL